jgi:Cobalamin-5-phosphate synthase
MNSPDPVRQPSFIERSWQDFCVAVSFLTVLPLASLAFPPTTADDGETDEQDESDAAIDTPPPLSTAQTGQGFLVRASALFPLVGVGVGTIAGLALLASFHIGLHPLACALIALVASAIITGGLHEDGLADFFDGVGGGRTVERRLEIMRDSHLGSFGAMALVFGVGIRASILTGVFSPDTAALVVITGATLSRAALPGMMRWLPPARADGLAAAAGSPGPTQIAIATLIAVVTALLTIGFWPAMSALAAAIIAAVIFALVARRLVGGQTGDVLGAAQVIVETAVLGAAAATVGGIGG